MIKGSDKTAEGIESKLAMNYYARFGLAELLSPNLEAAAKAGEPARVISILAPGRGGPIDTTDFGLAEKPNRAAITPCPCLAGSAQQRPLGSRTQTGPPNISLRSILRSPSCIYIPGSSEPM